MNFTRLRRHHQLVRLVIGFFAVSLVFGAFPGDLGTNLVADAITLAYGLFAVNVAAEGMERERRRPQMEVALFSAICIHRSIISFLYAAVEEIPMQPADAPFVLGAFIEKDTRYLAAPLFDMPLFYDEDLPERTPLGMAAHKHLGTVPVAIDRFLGRHIGVVTPEISAALERLEVSRFLRIATTSPESRHDRRVFDGWWELLGLEHELYGLLSQMSLELGLPVGDYPRPMNDSLASTVSGKLGWTQERTVLAAAQRPDPTDLTKPMDRFRPPRPRSNPARIA